MNPNTTPIDRAAINRENAQKSTGPKSGAGKKRSSLNALRHGLTGQVVVLPTEELAAYELFADAMLKDLQPLGFLETQIAQSITDDSWRLNRAKALENNMYALALNDNADSVVTDHPEAHAALVMAKSITSQIKTLATLSLHQHRIHAASSVISNSSANSRPNAASGNGRNCSTPPSSTKAMSRKTKHPAQPNPTIPPPMASLFQSPRWKPTPCATKSRNWPTQPLNMS
jgi:hypothetical protein